MAQLENNPEDTSQNISLRLEAFLYDSGFKRHFTLEPIRNEASHRSYQRIRFIGDDSNQPATIVLCSSVAPLNSSDYDFIAVTEMLFEREIPVPQIYGLEKSAGWILLSDGGSVDFETVYRQARAAGRSDRAELLIRNAIRLLLKISQVEIRTPVLERHFDHQKLFFEMQFLKEKLKAATLQLGVDFNFSAKLEAGLNHLCHQLAAGQPQLFTHRDFHSRNILCSDLTCDSEDVIPELTVIDYQDARVGLPWYDLTSFLYDPYLGLDPIAIYHGLSFYIEESGSSFSGINEQLFYQQATQRLLKALGSYFYLIFEKEMSEYISAVEPALNNLELILEDFSGFECAIEVQQFVTYLRERVVPSLTAYVNEVLK